MRLVIQRVAKAQVVVRKTGATSGEIGKGLFILVGFKKGDTKDQVTTLVEKIVKLRIMSDASDKMNLSVLDTQSSLLVVSQFTLYADTSQGNRPSFVKAEDPQKARELYDYFVEGLKKKGVPVATGSFGDYMDIKASLDGPVTIEMEI